jgi:glycine/D-amino acid oxidase-like deaminating enzyme
VLAAVWTPGSAHADPVRACAALAATADRAGARIAAPARVVAIDGRPEGGARLSLSGDRVLDAEAVLVAAGAWTDTVVRSLGAGIDLPVVGVAGQMWATAPQPPGTVRTTITAMESSLAWSTGGHALTHDDQGRRTRHLYGRQRRNGEIVFGGDRVLLGGDDVAGRAPDHDPAVDAEGIAVNHAHAASLLPALGDLRPVRTWSGVMPFTVDGLPLIGAVDGVPGLFVAAGLASSGFNRGPMTGWLAADLMLGRDVPPEVRSARPGSARGATAGPAARPGGR